MTDGVPKPDPAPQRRRYAVRGRRVLATAVAFGALSGVLISGALVHSASDAAFNGTTTNPANSWSAGKVAIFDDDATTAMFTVTGAKPGDSGTQCITVTYTGTLTVPVKLYASASSGTLRSYLTLDVEIGTGGSFADCTGITGTSSLYSGNLNTFATTYSSWSTGLGGWTPTGTGQTRTYRVTWTLDDDDAAAGKSAAVTLAWEVRSS
jgi:hypothetical protein